MIAAHPHRERLSEQLMLALYRSGRQADALAAYRNVRETLDELGLEPRPTLQQLERQILNHDEALDAPARPAAEPGTPGPAAGPTPLERTPATVLFAAFATTNEAEEEPEQTAALFDRIHAEAAAEIAAAGGMAEKGLVGALLATFASTADSPADHAARAANAALAIHARLIDAFGETVSLRMGLESGDVIMGRPGSFASGSPVSAASRLVGLAHAGEIVVGEAAARGLGPDFDLGGTNVLVRASGFDTPAPGVRKNVTVLFADLVDSSRLGEDLDAEAHHRLMSRYFHEMKTVIERHGGVVEKFIGDAVMGVFGVPVVHEDDALRGVRAAAEMLERLAKLNEEIEPIWGQRLEGRIGVNSGEVVAGDHRQGDRIVVGEAVNVAKRLEEIAETGEIVISETTHRLVQDAVTAEALPEREVKGRAFKARRLVDVRAGVPGRARRFDSPLVGRRHELDALRRVFESVVQHRACHLQTVLGPAGIGKSRLVQELVGEIDTDATVVRGRCLQYGEGITYWPLSEVVRDVIHEPSREAIAELLAGEEKAALIADLIAEAIGLGGSGAGVGEETFWAVRKLFESLAQRRPLVVVIDDLQWAEPTFIDLIDYLAGLSRDAPVLLLCMARPEVFDRNPDWGGGKLNASSMLLEPLDMDECRRLLTNLLGHGSLPPAVETQIAEAADGNALFAEELLAMLVDDGVLAWDDGRWQVADEIGELPVPQTINSLLAARLESLPEPERGVLLRASVEGAVFHRGAIAELAPETSRGSLDGNLARLVRRDIIRPDRASFTGDEAYRFRHILIRDAAYNSLPKATRADVHEQFAAWLERSAGGRMREYEEIIGYHVEQAFFCRRDIGSASEELSRLGETASQRLESAGRRALARSDLPAAIRLLRRASDPRLVEGARRARLLPELGAALIETGNEEPEAEKILAEARQLAATAGDDCADAHALVQQQVLRVMRAEDGATEEATRAIALVLPVFESCEDEHGLCRAWRLQALLQWNAAHAAAAVEAWEKAIFHACRAGDDEERSEIVSWIATALFIGPTPVPEAIVRCEQIRAEVSGNPGSEAWALRSLAGLYALDGRFDPARELLAEANAIFEELGQTRDSSASDIDGIVELLAGDPAAAERRLLTGYRVLEEKGDRAFLPTTAAHLAHAVHAQGRHEEARTLTQTSEQLAARDDLVTQIIWRTARAKVLAANGRLDEAEELAREAVTISEATDFLSTRADALVDLAEILRRAGRVDEANATLSDALALYERKGNRVAAETTRADLAVSYQV